MHSQHLLPNLCLLLLCSQAMGANWFTLDDRNAEGGALVEVDMSQLRQDGARHEIGVQVTHPAPRPHASGASFQSIQATVEFECDGRRPRLRDAVFYSGARGQGIAMVREPALLDPRSERIEILLPAKALELMVRAACARSVPTPVPAPAP